MKSQDNKDLFDIIIRYALIFCLGLGNLYLFYLIFTPLTYEVLFFFTRIFSNAILFGDGIMVNGVFFEIVSACVGGSAYYLLFILTFSTRGIDLLKRLIVVLFLFGVLFVFNIFRILLMIYIYGAVYFDTAHWIFWYFISTVFIFLEWIVAVKIFHLREIPIYSDIRFIFDSILGKKRKSGKKEKQPRKTSKKRK